MPAAAATRIAPAFAAAFARANSRHGWATQALISLAPDVLMLHWPLLAETAPLLAACGAAGDAVRDRCLRFLELMLAPYLAHHGGRARLLLLSDAGFALAAGPGVARDRMLDPLAATESSTCSRRWPASRRGDVRLARPRAPSSPTPSRRSR